MNEFFGGLLRLALRLVLLAMGLVVFASLLAAVLVLACVWALRAGWARLTGQPATPWVMRVDPRTGFDAVFRARRAPASTGGDAVDASPAPVPRRGGVLPGAADVTDVQAREVPDAR